MLILRIYLTMLKTNNKKLWKQIPHLSSAKIHSNIVTDQKNSRASYLKQNLQETQAHEHPVFDKSSHDSQNDADSSPPSFYHSDPANQETEQFAEEKTPHFSGFKIKKMHSEDIAFNQYESNAYVPIRPKPESLVSFGDNGQYTKNMKLKETVEVLRRNIIEMKLCFLQLTQQIEMQNTKSANLLGQYGEFGKQILKIVSLLKAKVSDKEQQLKKVQQKFLKEKSLKETYLQLLNKQWARNISLEQKLVQLSSAQDKLKTSRNYTEGFEPSPPGQQNIFLSSCLSNNEQIKPEKIGHCFRKSSLAVSSEIGDWKKEFGQSRKFQMNNQVDLNRNNRFTPKHRKMSYQVQPESSRISTSEKPTNGINREIQLKKMSNRIHLLSSELKEQINKYKNDSDLK